MLLQHIIQRNLALAAWWYWTAFKVFSNVWWQFFWEFNFKPKRSIKTASAILERILLCQITLPPPHRFPACRSGIPGETWRPGPRGPAAGRREGAWAGPPGVLGADAAGPARALGNPGMSQAPRARCCLSSSGSRRPAEPAPSSPAGVRGTGTRVPRGPSAWSQAG